MSTINSLLQRGTALLKAAHIEQPRREARWLLQEALKISHGELLTRAYGDDPEISEEPYCSWIARRARHEPFAYIVGKKEFWSLDFSLSTATLIPRPDTEILIEAALMFYPNRQENLSILDLGTGTGCLLIAALSEYPHAQGLGIDIDPQSVKIAQKNLATHHLSNRGNIFLSDWDDVLSQRDCFDLIFSNPPYIPQHDIASLEENVKAYEPMLALDGGQDGLDAYRYLFSRIKHYMHDKSIAIFEMGISQRDDIIRLARTHHLKPLKILQDYASIERAIVLQRDLS